MPLTTGTNLTRLASTTKTPSSSPAGAFGSAASLSRRTSEEMGTARAWDRSATMMSAEADRPGLSASEGSARETTT